MTKIFTNITILMLLLLMINANAETKLLTNYVTQPVKHTFKI
jgi:hypothetical protein